MADDDNIAEPLLPQEGGGDNTDKTFREGLYDFLEGKTPYGRIYEWFTVTLILLSVASFVLATLFVDDYTPYEWGKRDGGLCDDLCDALFFGNYADNGLQVLGIGNTSVLELVTIAVFSMDFLLRFYTADVEDPVAYRGFLGRLRYLVSFYAIIDLVSTVPFYVDSFILVNSNIVASQVSDKT